MASVGKFVVKGGRRLYQLTDAGREALRTEIARLRRMLENAQEV